MANTEDRKENVEKAFISEAKNDSNTFISMELLGRLTDTRGKYIR